MAKTISVKFNGEEYTLEYTRKSIEQMERNGFNVSEITSKPVTTIPLLFSGAFIAHHPNVKTEVIDEILAAVKGKTELMQKLAEMYNEPIETLLLREPDENSGNAEWGANW